MLHDTHVNKAAEVPTMWDEVKVLPQSDIANLAEIAKRKGKDRYIGVLNGEVAEKTLDLDLNPFINETFEVVAFLGDLDTEKLLLSMERHRLGVLKRTVNVPFKFVMDANDLYHFTLAAEGCAVIVLHN